MVKIFSCLYRMDEEKPKKIRKPRKVKEPKAPRKPKKIKEEKPKMMIEEKLVVLVFD